MEVQNPTKKLFYYQQIKTISLLNNMSHNNYEMLTNNNQITMYNF